MFFLGHLPCTHFPPPVGTPPFISFAYMYFVIWIQFIVKKDTKPALVGQNKVHPSLSCQAGNVYRQVLSELLLPYMCKINLFKQFLSLPSSALSWVFFFCKDIPILPLFIPIPALLILQGHLILSLSQKLM